LNKTIRDNFIKGSLRSSQGQIAIILILVIAAMLIFFAVTLNIGKISHVKSMATIASNVSAGLLGSAMASYAQNLSMTHLKGTTKICAFTSILAIILVIIVIIISIVTHQYYLIGFAIAGLVLAVVSLILQVLVIQPGITDAWNRVINKTLALRNQLTEGAIQSALLKVVEDRVMVPDVTDVDGDRLWVPDPGAPGATPFADTASRFAIYYGERLQSIKAAEIADIEEFVRALREFLYNGGDGWGIHDPVAAGDCWGIAECNKCCRPKEMFVPGIDNLDSSGVPQPVRIRPEDCDEAIDWAAVCGGSSTYGIKYPWVYDPQLENSARTSFYSFRELLGVDDEHRDYYKDLPSSSPWDPNSIPQNLHVAADRTFYLEDATNFYVLPEYSPDVAEKRKGIFPFFQKIKDWGVELKKETDYDFAAKPRECHWCDSRAGNCTPCTSVTEGPHDHPREIPQLILPLNPGNPADGLIYNTSYFVDGLDNPVDLANPANPPTAVDMVSLPGNILAADNVCAQYSLYPAPQAGGFWKEGGDRYCSGPDDTPNDPNDTVWPYFENCPKFQGASCPIEGCSCLEGDATQFPDDAVDDLIYGIRDFIEFAKEFLRQAESDLVAFSAKFQDWYPELARWIEPQSPPASRDSALACFSCNLTDPNEGALWVWLKEMTEIFNRLTAWVETSYEGNACGDVWCVPPQSDLSCRAVPDDEIVMFDANRNGTNGEIEDIVDCLDYNVEGYDYVAAAAFRQCLDNCAPPKCSIGEELPEYHLDGTTPYNFPPGGGPGPLDCDPSNIDPWVEAMQQNLVDAVRAKGTRRGNEYRFERCGQTCSLADCFSLSGSLLPYGAAGYRPEAYAEGNPSLSDEWVKITALNDCLDNCNNENCKVGPRLPPDDPPPPDYYPAVPFDETVHCGLAWGPGNPWYDGIVAYRNSLIPVDEADVAAFLKCYDSCSNANCAAMPAVHTSNGAAYTWTTPPSTFLAIDSQLMLNCQADCVTNLADCQSMPEFQSSNPLIPYVWTTSPTLFTVLDCDALAVPPTPLPPWNAEIAANLLAVPTSFCDAVTGLPAAPWNGEILVNLMDAGGVSCDLNPNGWLTRTRQSAIEATNQVTKFEKRRNFLDRRLEELIVDDPIQNKKGILPILEEAIDKFNNFLIGPSLDPLDPTGPAQKIIKYRISYNPNKDVGLPYHAVYGWQDEVALGSPERGNWHLVKVEARLPGNCDNACGIGGGPDPEWPRIKTYTKNWGMTRCYELINTDGLVKFRVTRYDEERDSGLLSFPNGVPLWKPRSAHPQRSLTPSGGGDPDMFKADNLGGDCGPSTITKFVDGQPTTFAGFPAGIYQGAFIVEDLIPRPDPNQNERCWNSVHHLLSRGVTSETCARYMWEGGRMNFRFISCQDIPF
jgi:hypothetical protein